MSSDSTDPFRHLRGPAEGDPPTASSRDSASAWDGFDEDEDDDGSLDILVADTSAAPVFAGEAELFDDLDSSSLDFLVADTIASRVFASAREGLGDHDDDEAHPMPAHEYVARGALSQVESEAKLVEALNDRCTGAAFVEGGDPAVVASLRRLAQTAWIHYHHARAAAEPLDGDPTFGPLAERAVTRAHRAVLAIKRAAGRAVTRAAIMARNAARDRLRVPARLRHVRRPAGLCSRPRAPAARRVRLSAVASAGSGGEEPAPEPLGRPSSPRPPVRREP